MTFKVEVVFTICRSTGGCRTPETGTDTEGHLCEKRLEMFLLKVPWLRLIYTNGNMTPDTGSLTEKHFCAKLLETLVLKVT